MRLCSVVGGSGPPHAVSPKWALKSCLCPGGRLADTGKLYWPKSKPCRVGVHGFTYSLSLLRPPTIEKSLDQLPIQTRIKSFFHLE